MTIAIGPIKLKLLTVTVNKILKTKITLVLDHTFLVLTVRLLIS